MKKAPDAFRTISEVSDWLDTPAHVLRFWESKFSQVKPVKRAGGRRYYRPEDMRLLGGIKQLLHSDGLTIKGVQKILREQGVKHVADLSPDVNGGPAAAGDMDSLTDEITKQVASTARAQARPAAPEPLNLGEMQPARADTEAVQAAARKPAAPPTPNGDDDRQAPLFLHPEDAAAQPADSAAPLQESDDDKVSALYGRLKSLRRRMEDA